MSAAESPQPAAAQASEVDAAPNDFLFTVNQLAVVAKRTWVGINKLGGVGRIKSRKVEDSVNYYSVAYVLGGREEHIDEQYIQAASNTIEPRERKRTDFYEAENSCSSPKRRKLTKAQAASPSPKSKPAAKKRKSSAAAARKTLTASAATSSSASKSHTSTAASASTGFSGSTYAPIEKFYIPPDAEEEEEEEQTEEVSDRVYELALIIHHAVTSRAADAAENGEEFDGMADVDELMHTLLGPGSGGSADSGGDGGAHSEEVTGDSSLAAMYDITESLFNEALEYLQDANKIMLIDGSPRQLVMI